MNVYDFDKTIYKNDSTADFYFFSIKRHPSIILLLPHLAYSAFLWMTGRINKTAFKERFYKFLTKIPDIDSDVEKFWDKNEHKIKKFYKRRRQSDDVIISASPEFLLKPICRRLEINHLYASEVDKKSGIYSGENCWGREKVNRFYKAFGENAVIDKFYSDSLSDTPLADIALKSFIVSGNRIIPWKEFSENKKIDFFSREFVMFVAIGFINTFNGVFFSWLYSLFLNPNVAFAAGYISSLAINYILNSKINFGRKLEFTKFIKFCISYIPNFIIQNITVFLLFNILKLHKLIAYAAAAVVSIPITFICLKLFVFKKSEP